MKFIRIYSKDDRYFKEAMEIYKSSFPIFEQRTLKSQTDVLENKQYYCSVICENDELIGILFYWEYDKYRYIEHLAISKELRGKNYGSKILEKFCQSNKNTILEIDIPIDDISIKRLNFYSKLGFKIQNFEHIHPPYRKEYEGHSLKVMSYNKDLSEEEYYIFNEFLNKTVMKFSECNV